MQLTLTTAGLAALVDAENTGTDPVELAEIGITATSFAPSAALTAVPAELKRIATIGGDVVADDVMHVLLRDESADTYTLRGFGLYLEDGTLFASYSQADPISTKAALAVLLLAIDVRFSALDATLIEFGDTNFVDPPATTSRAGVVELATHAETQTGTDAERAVTPAGLKYVLDNSSIADASTTVKGKVELATNAETQTGTDAERAVTPAALSSRTATTTRTGVVELATNAEAQAGTDTERAVTPAGLAATVPNATDSVRGKVELATGAEVLAGADTERAVTPAGLAGRTATATRTGLVELATAAEAQAGADTERAVTPAGLAAAVPNASEAARGKVELATSAEALAGLDTERAVTPAGMAAALSALSATILASPALPRAFANVQGRLTNGACDVRGFGVDSVARTDTGLHLVSFSALMPDDRYVVTFGVVGVNESINIVPFSKSQGGFQCQVQTGQANDGSGRVDPPEFFFTIHVPPA